MSCRRALRKCLEQRGGEFVAELIDTAQTQDSCYLLFSAYPTDLWSLMQLHEKRAGDGLSEESARFYAGQLVFALDAIHSSGMR
eukprot:SAG22_NODE_183_length_16031_cov_36.647000_8_plen_84_part_00